MSKPAAAKTDSSPKSGPAARGKSLLSGKRGLAVGIVGLAVASGAVIWLLLGGRGQANKAGPAGPRITLKQGFAALDAGRYAEARRIARKLRAGKLRAAQAAQAAYVLGAAAAAEADEFWGRERRELFVAAAKHLHEAQRAGFPPDRLGEGWFLLGKSLYLSGQVAESRSALEQALQAGAEETAEVHRLLAGAYRAGDTADLQQALVHAQALLAEPELNDEERQAGQLALANVFWQQRRFADCAQALSEIPEESALHAEVLLMRGRLALREARDARQKLAETASRAEREVVKLLYDEAIARLRQVQVDPLATRSVRRSTYLIGVCFLEMGDSTAALAQFQRTRDLYLDTPEGLSAGLQEADLLRQAKRDDDAVAAYRRVLTASADPERFQTLWIPLESFRLRVLAAVNQYLQAEEYARAVALAEVLAPLFPRPRAVELLADAYRQWGDHTLADAERQSEPLATASRAKGRQLLRRAGTEFERLAQLNFTSRQYPEDVWRAADANLAGQNYRGAAKLLDEYLRNEPQRRRPAALVRVGAAQLALGRVDEALAALRECMDFYPASVASFEARLVAAQAHIAKADAATAEKLLRENLAGEVLTPQSREWRESLFALGELLEQEGRYDEAIDRLGEAVARYPEVRRPVDARYLIGEAYRKASQIPRAKIASDTSETARAAHRKQMEQMLEQAAIHYQQAQGALNRRQEKAELTALEKIVLRNSYFLVGATLFELERYEEAIRVYSTATNRYQHDPEVLDAFVQIASCQRRLGRPNEARGAVQQAKVVLSRIKKDDAAFTQVTNYNRADWSAMLDWLSRL